MGVLEAPQSSSTLSKGEIFDVLTGVQWAFVISVAFTFTAGIHVYHERNMRLADLDAGPDFEIEEG